MKVLFRTDAGTYLYSLYVPDGLIERIWSANDCPDHSQDEYIAIITDAATEASKFYAKRP